MINVKGSDLALLLRETPDKEWVKIKYPPLTEVKDYSKKVLNIN